MRATARGCLSSRRSWRPDDEDATGCPACSPGRCGWPAVTLGDRPHAGLQELCGEQVRPPSRSAASGHLPREPCCDSRPLRPRDGGWRGLSMPCLSAMSTSSQSLSAAVQLPCAEATRTAESAAPTAFQERGWRPNDKNASDTAETSPRRNIGCRPHGARKLDKRCAHRADGAPGSARSSFRRSEMLCGQGQGRTADRPLFRSTAPSAVRTCKNGRH